MTQINTEYKNLGPIVKELNQIGTCNFFQFPDEGCVYMVVAQVPDGYICISLDDLQPFTQPGETIVEPCEVNKIDIQVEL
jgi:hypothetical protein